MSRLIFPLKYVTHEEAEEVRQLLADKGIPVFETDAGFFGTSVAGYWLENGEDETTAKGLLEQYSIERSMRVRHDYAERASTGEADTLWKRFKTRPLTLLLSTILIIFILYISIMPFY